jgi:L-fuculose-phosphate aldolase
MNDAEYSVRKEIIATCLAMEKKGINQGTSGNVSARWDDGLLVTPSGLSYDMMAPEEIIYLEGMGRLTDRIVHRPNGVFTVT